MGAEQAFQLYVEIAAIDRFTAPLRSMGAQLGLLGKQSQAVKQQLSSFKAMAVTGGVITGIGAAMTAGLVKAAESASKLQTSVLGVANAMKLTNAQQQQLTNMSMTQGIETAFSAVQTAGLYQSMSQGGFSNSMIFNKALSDKMIKFADVQYLSSNGQQDPNTAVLDATGMAHLYQLYSPQQLGPFLDTLNAALAHTHGGIDPFATQFKYFAQTANNKGVSSQQAVMDEMFLMRMGVGGGGRSMGTSFNDFLLYMTGTKSKAAAKAMMQAGLMQNGHSAFTTANGDFVGIPQAVQIMGEFNKRFKGNSNIEDKLLQTIFGTQGMRVAQALMTKNNGALDQYNLIQQQVQNTATVDQMQKSYNQSPAGQAKQALTTFEDIVQAFGQQLLPTFTKGLNLINKITGAILNFAIAHPRIVKMAAAFAMVATAVALVVGPVLLLTGALGYLFTSSSLGAGAKILARSFTGMLGPVALVISASYLLYEAWTHNWGGIQQKTASVVNWMKSEVPKVTKLVQGLLKALGIETTKQVEVAGKNGKHIAGMNGSPLMKTVTSFQIPSWAKWVAGAILAQKAVGGVVTVIGGITKGVTAFNRLTGVVGGSIKVFTGLVREWSLVGALYRVITSGVLKMSMAILRITGLTKVWTALQVAFNAVMDMNPIALIVIGVAALVAVVVVLIMHWKEVVAWVQKVADRFNHLGTGVKILLTLFAPFLTLPLLIIANWQKIVTWFNGFVHTMENVGHNIATGLWNGIKGATSWLQGHMTAWIDNVVPGPIRKFLGIHSPSRLMAQYGLYTAQGLAQGMLNSSHLVQHAAQQLSIAATPNLDSQESNLSRIFQRVGPAQINNTNQIEIHIHGADEKSATGIVDEISRRLGPIARKKNMSHPFGPNRMAFGG